MLDHDQKFPLPSFSRAEKNDPITTCYFDGAAGEALFSLRSTKLEAWIRWIGIGAKIGNNKPKPY